MQLGTGGTLNELHWGRTKLVKLEILGMFSRIRCGFCAGEMRVIRHLGDVWVSRDTGYTWTLLVATAPWAARAHMGMTATSDGRLILAGVSVCLLILEGDGLGESRAVGEGEDVRGD